jgi:uncharacterized damage-inducible protein DinB
MSDQDLRKHLAKVLDWADAHVDFDAAVTAIPAKARGVRPQGLPYSAWELLEHMRRAQADILDFCLNADYAERSWPADYWPEDAAPPTPGAWDEAVAAFRRDRDALKRLCLDAAIDLFAAIPHGDGQTYLREILLVADHNAYHLGQLVAVRRQVDAWEAG